MLNYSLNSKARVVAASARPIQHKNTIDYSNHLFPFIINHFCIYSSMALTTITLYMSYLRNSPFELTSISGVPLKLIVAYLTKINSKVFKFKCIVLLKNLKSLNLCRTKIK